VIEPGGPLAPLASAPYPGLAPELLESAVAAVAIQPVVARFVADIEIEKTIVIEVGPGSAVGIDGIHQAGFAGHVGEGAVAVVAEQSRPYGVLQPGAARNKQVQEAIVVVVGLDEIEPAVVVHESGRRATILKCTTALVA